MKRQSRQLETLSCLLGLSLASACAAAQTGPTDGVFFFVLENDVLGELSQDRNYTNGLKLGWMTPKGAEPVWAQTLARSLTPTDEQSDTRLEFEIGQSMFTPEKIGLDVPEPTDRPYAGFAYVSIGLVDRPSENRLDQYQLVLGVVGPSSRAKELQRWVHQRIGATEPRGWDTQIRDQFAGEIRYQHTRRLELAPRKLGRYELELTPHAGGSLGNFTITANAGVGLRFGRNLPEDFGPPRVSPSLPGSGYFEPSGGLGWYVFGGIDARYVARSLVLDEPSTSGNSVNRRSWVGDIQGGIAIYRNRLRVSYTQVWRTREFATQRDRFSSFGAIAVTYLY